MCVSTLVIIYVQHPNQFINLTCNIQIWRKPTILHYLAQFVGVSKLVFWVCHYSGSVIIIQLRSVFGHECMHFAGENKLSILFVILPWITKQNKTFCSHIYKC